MRIYAILDPEVVAKEKLLWAAERALLGGASLLQVRAKTWSTERRVELLRELLPLARERGASLIVDDDPWAALRAGVGLHLGDRDMPLPRARALLPDAVIGRTCSGSLAKAMWAQGVGASYVAFGPVFPTPTKPEKPPISLAVLERAKGALRIPYYAIGGITPRNLGLLAPYRPHGIAAIRAIFAAPDPAQAVRDLLEAWEEALAREKP